MRCSLALFVLLSAALPAHTQTGPANSETLGILADDSSLLAECRLFLTRADFRTPALRKLVEEKLQQHQIKWARLSQSGSLDDNIRQIQSATETTCKEALKGSLILPPKTIIAPPVPGTPPPLTAGRNDRGITITPQTPVPQIEPWPPPIATDQATFTVDRAKLRTVGDFSDAVMGRLNEAGIRHLRFWGAPNGVAIVVPMDPVDQHGRPTRNGPSGASPEARAGGPLTTIMAGFRRLISEPIRDLRILLFVLTDDSKAKSPAVPMTANIGRQWT